MFSRFDTIAYRNVTDRRTDGQTDRIVVSISRGSIAVLTRDNKISAVAERPRDASFLSVVSFNSTNRRVESFIVSYVGYRFVSACS